MSIITVHGFDIETDNIPVTTRDQLLKRAIGHVTGNEVASAVLAKEKRAIAGAEGKLDSVTDAMLAAWRENPANTLAADTWEQEMRAAKVQSILDGTLSVRVPSSGRTVRDPVEAEMRRIAAGEIGLVLSQQSPPAQFPGKDVKLGHLDPALARLINRKLAEVTIGTETVTGNDLIDRRLAKVDHADRIRKLAERAVADAKRLRDQSAKAVADGAIELL